MYKRVDWLVEGHTTPALARMEHQLRKKFRRRQNLSSGDDISGSESPEPVIAVEDPGEFFIAGAQAGNRGRYLIESYVERSQENDDDDDGNDDEDDDVEASKAAASKLSDELTRVKAFGSFATAAVMPTFPLPGIVLKDNNAHLSLPLDATGLQHLKDVCEIAPFGRGEETVVDQTFRNTWQTGPEGFDITSPFWPEFLVGLLPDLKRDLGIEANCKIELELYKLLAYEKGCFFKPHKDSEKSKRMIGTMVMVLPSIYEGGELIVRHQDQEKIFDFSKDSARYIQYAAFYADCIHEVKPVTSGARICLVYNILKKSSKGSLPAPGSQEKIAKVARAIQDLKEVVENPEKPFCFVLNHEYTQQSLCLDLLKRDDWAVGSILRAAAKQVEGCHFYLARLDLEVKIEQGDASHEDDYCRLKISDFVKPCGKAISKPFQIKEDYMDLPLYPEDRINKHASKESWDGQFGNASVFLKQHYHVTCLTLFFTDLDKIHQSKQPTKENSGALSRK